MGQLDSYMALLIKIIVAVAVTLITKYVIPVLKAWYEEKVDIKIKNAIKDAVEAAEQTIKGSGMVTTKKEEVMDIVVEFMEKHGYAIDEKKLNIWIEAAVFAMNLNKQEKKSKK